jgi:hypothetical protein
MKYIFVLHGKFKKLSIHLFSDLLSDIIFYLSSLLVKMSIFYFSFKFRKNLLLKIQG